jgi:hypothetical protein
LLSNLANRAQPILRYDLGDSVVAKPEPCACGNALPAICVEGRRDDVLEMQAPDGKLVRLLPLALTTIVEEAAHVHRFQLVQTAPDRLMLRLEPGADNVRRALWHAAAPALRTYLTQQSLPNVHVGLDGQPPHSDGAAASSGKSWSRWTLRRTPRAHHSDLGPPQRWTCSFIAGQRAAAREPCHRAT